MKNYANLANLIIQKVGGKENVQSVEHCVTRLRFTLQDEKLADDEALKKMEGVITVMHSVGQYQVVIGNEVADVYSEVCKILGRQTMVKKNQPKLSFKDKFMDYITAIILPNMGLMASCGIIKGLLVLLSYFNLIQSGSGIYLLLNAIGDAIFYFFPLLLGYNTAKKLNATPFLGLIIGAILCYPAINGVDLNIGGTVFNITYTSTFLPVILLVFIAAPLERFFMRKLPSSLRSFLTPALVLLLVVPVGFLFIGPVANQLGSLLSQAFIALYNFNPILTGIVLGGTIQILIIFGVHTVIGMASVINIIQGIPDPIMPTKAFQTFSQTAVVFAIYLKTKDKELKKLALPAAISGLLGITEPAIYGITLPRIKMFAISCIGSALAGGLAAFFQFRMYSITGMGFFTLLGLLDPEHPQILPILLCLSVAVLFSFIAAFVLYRDEDYRPQEKNENQVKPGKIQREDISSPIEGVVKPLAELNDPAFANGALGEGIVITPYADRAVAPFDGVVRALFPTNHAIGLVSDQGCEVLIHIGIDTVKLEGKYFHPQIKTGDCVKKGDPLVIFESEQIRAEGYCLDTPVIITNSKDYADVVTTNNAKTVSELAPLLTILRKEIPDAEQ